ncbi:ASCH domain-containing protein [Burkholderia cenocepacia]|uniref:ASCH domain-containing protein n=1 Tax=Burkholderia cenocepacia TaxID=95486 RepID=UPI0023B958A9|nr:ASCH domain-containing protein [Burkholderia cenocepacia]MDF0506534.1 ASCH domain-containing protein [Burkholderia cenocepacia]
MKDLILPLNTRYFLDIRAGTKGEEYRLCTPFWRKRIEGRVYRNVVLTMGYPRADDHDRRIVRPWRGYEVKRIVHPHFGPDEVEVFAIQLTEKGTT